jgi:hypothetical protein
VIQVIKAKMEGRDVEEVIEEILRDTKSKIADVLLDMVEHDYGFTKKDAIEFLSLYKERDYLVVDDFDESIGLIKHFVLDEVLFFDPVLRQILPHSKTTLIAIRELLNLAGS